MFKLARLMFICLTLVLTALGSLNVPALAQSNSLFVDPPLGVSAVDREIDGKIQNLQSDPTAALVSKMSVNVAALQQNVIAIRLPDGKVISANKDYIEQHSKGTYSWFGTTDPGEMQVILVVDGDSITGSISGLQGTYSITPLGNGFHGLTKIDAGRFPQDHGFNKESLPQQIPIVPGENDVVTRKDLDAAAPTANVTVDILMAYTPQMRAAYSGNAATFMQLAVNAANASYTKSNAGVTLRMVGTMEITGYNETGKTFGTILNDARTGVGTMSAVQARRDTLKADLVSVFVNNTAYCGLAYLNSSSTYAYSTTYYNCAISNKSFAHEVGHNFGARHDYPITDSKVTPYRYAHGYINNNGTKWRTILSYGSACGNCPRLDFFSNPSKTYQGKVTGTAEFHDNARLHRVRAATVAAFRTGGGGGTPGKITVTPTTGFTSTGPAGGPFSPSFKNYVVKNTGGSTVNVTASETIYGMSVSPTSGSLSPGASLTLRVSHNAAANSIAAGRTETGTLSIKNTTNGSGNTSRSLRITATSTASGNDNIASAASISGSSGTKTIASNASYTLESGEPKHSVRVSGANARSAWWKWTAPSNYQMRFDSAGSGAGDTVIAIYVASNSSSPSVRSLTQIAANDNSAGGLDGRVYLNAVRGKTYFITVAALNSTTRTGSYKLNWTSRSGSNLGLVSSILPSARAVKNGSPATAFATLTNSSKYNATNCSIAMPSGSLGNSMFQFRTANTANQLIGTVNTPVNIPAGRSQNFVFGITPRNTISGSDVRLVFDCENMSPVTTIVGVNSFGLSSSTSSPADMVAVADTVKRNGIVDIPGNNGLSFFVAAVVNNGGPRTSITASVDDGAATLPVDFTLCRSSSSGACIGTPARSVTWTASTNVPYTFTIFVKGRGNVPFNPATNRAYLRFKQGSAVRGGSSVAIRTSGG